MSRKTTMKIGKTGTVVLGFLSALPLLLCQLSGELGIAYARTVSRACVRFKAAAKS